LRLNATSTHYLPACVWAATIFVASALHTNAIVSQDILDYDKLIHLGVYFVFGILVHRALRFEQSPVWLRTSASLFTILITALYGVSDEFHQHFVPGRSMEFFDWVADALGGIVAVGVVTLASRLRSRAKVES
jgi:VanZ family protein